MRFRDFSRLIIIENLPYLLLAICSLHLLAKSLLLKHQLYYVPFKITNTHFALTCVIIMFLCLLFSLVCVDLLFQTHSTYRYVIVMNIAVIGCALFITGYLLGHIVEIGFAQMNKYTCRQLGINTFYTNSTVSINEKVDKYEKDRCAEAVFLEFQEISIDLLIHIFFIPLHISATAFSWTFSGLFRKRCHEDHA